MHRTLTQDKPAFRLMACFAMIAALWLTTAQATELSHLQGWEDSYEQCLTCQADNSSAVEFNGPTRTLQDAGKPVFSAPLQQASRQFLPAPLARGPPSYP